MIRLQLFWTNPEEDFLQVVVFPRKTGAGEGIRTLDPNLGKIRLYEIFILNQILIKLLKNPNTIRTFLKAVRLECFVLNVLAVAATLNDPAIRGSCVQVSRRKTEYFGSIPPRRLAKIGLAEWRFVKQIGIIEFP